MSGSLSLCFKFLILDYYLNHPCLCTSLHSFDLLYIHMHTCIIDHHCPWYCVVSVAVSFGRGWGHLCLGQWISPGTDCWWYHSGCHWCLHPAGLYSHHEQDLWISRLPAYQLGYIQMLTSSLSLPLSPPPLSLPPSLPLFLSLSLSLSPFLLTYSISLSTCIQNSIALRLNTRTNSHSKCTSSNSSTSTPLCFTLLSSRESKYRLCHEVAVWDSLFELHLRLQCNWVNLLSKSLYTCNYGIVWAGCLC